jgi:hypothetical protein
MNDKDVAAVAAPGDERRTIKKIRLDHYKEFSEILKIKYSNNEEDMNNNEDEEFDHIVYLGLIQWTKEEVGYEIIHDGKIADKRVLKILIKIANELLLIHTYPKVEGITLQAILNKVIGPMDTRSKKKYRKTVLYYCNVDENIIDKCHDSRLDVLDVSGFVRRVPRCL